MSSRTWNGSIETANRVFLWAQVALVFILIECALWSAGAAQKTFSLIAMLAIIAFTLLDGSNLKELGLGKSGFRPALVVIPLAALMAGSFVAIGAWAGTLRILFGTGSIALHAFGYGVWSLEQEFILNSFFYLLLERLLGNSHRTAVLAAALFSFAHIPNPVLVPATLVGGMLFIEAFRRWRNIYPLGAAHAMLGLALAITAPDAWMHHMRVGLSFLRFHIHAG